MRNFWRFHDIRAAEGWARWFDDMRHMAFLMIVFILLLFEYKRQFLFYTIIASIVCAIFSFHCWREYERLEREKIKKESLD